MASLGPNELIKTYCPIPSDETQILHPSWRRIILEPSWPVLLLWCECGKAPFCSNPLGRNKFWCTHFFPPSTTNIQLTQSAGWFTGANISLMTCLLISSLTFHCITKAMHLVACMTPLVPSFDLKECCPGTAWLHHSLRCSVFVFVFCINFSSSLFSVSSLGLCLRFTWLKPRLLGKSLPLCASMMIGRGGQQLEGPQGPHCLTTQIWHWVA